MNCAHVPFIIFAARHGAVISSKRTGLLEKSTRIPPVGDRGFLDIGLWKHLGYATIEHVAPQTPSDNNDVWDGNLYINPRLIDSMGNLVLLPLAENSFIGNLNWNSKKNFYKALLASDKRIVEEWIFEAEQKGMKVSHAIKSNLKESYNLSLLDSVVQVEHWDSNFVKERSKNLCDLCWEQIRSWLD